MNTIAVTTGKTFQPDQLNAVSIVDLIYRTVIKFIEVSGDLFGIAHDRTSLICYVQGNNINVISCKDYSVKMIPNTVPLRYSYVSTHAEKIFVSNQKQHKVIYFLNDGTTVWKF